jgi:hypothetical protein
VGVLPLVVVLDRPTVIVTVDPCGAVAFGSGLCAITRPLFDGLDAAVSTDTWNPAPCSDAVASLWLCPRTLGTVAVCGPDDTMSVTVLPFASCDPGAGCVVITLPDGTVVLAWLRERTEKPALLSVCVALTWSWPVTSGTLTGAGPADTTTLIVSPLRTCDPGCGSVLMTSLGGTLSLCCDWRDTFKPSPVNVVLALANG